jgi:hypothetical protein
MAARPLVVAVRSRLLLDLLRVLLVVAVGSRLMLVILKASAPEAQSHSMLVLVAPELLRTVAQSSSQLGPRMPQLLVTPTVVASLSSAA